MRSPGLRSSRARVAGPDPDLAREDQRLGAAARLRQPALDEQLVEADARLRACAGRSLALGSPAYRGTAPLHRDSPRAAATGPASVRTRLTVDVFASQVDRATAGEPRR